MNSDDQAHIYTSPRLFEVWTWGVGHHGLLLRSFPTDQHPTRVEISFKPASCVCLPSYLHGLQIAMGTADLLQQVRAVLGRGLGNDETLYAVRAGESFGWVLGGSVIGAEDDRGYNEPSMFDPPLLRRGDEFTPERRELFSTYAGH